MYVINVSASGDYRVLLGGDDASYVFNVQDPILSDPIFNPLREFTDGLATEGVSMVHMESDTFRTFTHTVQGGAVLAKDGISLPIFGYVQSNSAQIIAALNAINDQTDEPDQVPSP